MGFILSYLLKAQVRSKDFYDLVSDEYVIIENEITEFIKAKLYTFKKDVISNKPNFVQLTEKNCYITRNELRNCFEEFCKNELGNPTISKQKNFNSKFLNIIQSKEFGFCNIEQRPNINGARPRIYKNIMVPSQELIKQSQNQENNLIKVEPLTKQEPVNKKDLLKDIIFGQNIGF